MSQPIRNKSDDIMSSWVHYLMQDITTPPKPLYVCAPLVAVADPMESIVGQITLWNKVTYNLFPKSAVILTRSVHLNSS